MIFKTIPNRNTEEEKKEYNYKRRIQTNDGASISNSIVVAEYPENSSEHHLRQAYS
jgi:hypothetical protein